MRPKDTKRAIDQLILDIQYNEWYCVQGDSESELEFWEKNLIVVGLRNLLLDADFYIGGIKDEMIYICDPKINTECNKRGCHINSGPCFMTKKHKYQKIEED